MATPEDIVNIALSNLGHSPQLVTSLSGTTTTEVLAGLHYPMARDALLSEINWNFAIKRAALKPNTTEPVFGFSNAYDMPSDMIRIIRTADGSKWRKEGAKLLSDTAPGTAVAITGATQANPVVITLAKLFPDSASVLFASVGGMSNLNGVIFQTDNPTSTTFELQGTDGTAFGAYTSGGTVQQLNVEVEYVFQETTTTNYPAQFVELLAFRLAAQLAPRLTDNANMTGQMWDIYNRKLAVAAHSDAVENTPRGFSSEDFLNARGSTFRDGNNWDLWAN